MPASWRSAYVGVDAPFTRGMDHSIMGGHMRNPSRHPLITLFVIFAFLAQASGLSGCGEAEKAYKEATGQTVVDDSVVRSKLEIVNQMSDNTYNQFGALVDHAVEVGRRADAGDIDGAADIMINSISGEADALSATLKELGAAEEIIKNQTDAARVAGAEISPNLCFDPLSCVALATAVVGIYKLAQYYKTEAKVSMESKARKDTALANGDVDGVYKENKILNDTFHRVTNETGSQVLKVVTNAAKPVIGAGTLIVNAVGNHLIDPNKTPKLKVFGGTKECADLTPGAAPSSNGCKVVYGEVPTSTKTVTVPGVPAGNLDMMLWAKDMARLLMKNVAITQSAITTLLRDLIALSDATAKNIKASDAGTYTAPSDGGGDTTPPVSDPLPWSYSGTTSTTVRATSDHGVRGSVDCAFHSEETLTLNADGSLTGSGTSGYYKFNGDGSGAGCSDDQILSQTWTGTHSNGYYSMTNQNGRTMSGSYTALSMSGTASFAGSVTLSNGQPVTVTYMSSTGTWYRK
ncbi:MAG: hypothetical protein HQK85_07480 [Nitrospinae bacterium]|nr:hypothetical protein [Nitrospinota bacterium]